MHMNASLQCQVKSSLTSKNPQYFGLNLLTFKF